MSLTRIGSIGINTGIAFAGVTTIVTLNTANDALSIGATVNVGSGITLGASGDIFATGVSTVTTLKVGSGVTVSSDGDIFATGVTTATSFVGDGSQLTGVASTENIRTNTNATFLQNVNVSGSTTTGSLVSSGAISGTTGTFSGAVSGTTGTFTGNITASSSNIKAGDSSSSTNNRLQLGAATYGDLELYHDGTSSYIDNATNDLFIRNTGDDITIQAADDIYLNPQNGEAGIKVIGDGAVELYYDNSKIFETGTDQATITGKLTINRSSNDEKLILSGSASPYIRFQESTTNKAYMQWSSNGYIEIYNSETSKGMRVGGSGVEVLDDVKFTAGDSQDLQIFHDGDNSFIIDEGTGNLYVQANSFVAIRASDHNETMAKFIRDGAVELYHDGTKRFETTSTGFEGYGTQFKFSDAGDLDVIINADTDNNDESHNPRLVFQQDGSVNCLAVGVEGSGGDNYTNSSQNTPYFEALDGHGGLGMEFATNNTRRMRINYGGVIDGDFNDTSDGNLKENIVSISSTIDKVKALRPVTFDWKDKTKPTNYSGFIAQEVKEIYPNLVTGEEHTAEEPWKNYSLNTTGLVAYLTKALQEVIAKMESLEERIKTLEG